MTDHRNPLLLRVFQHIAYALILAANALYSAVRFLIQHINGIMWYAFFVWIAFALSMCQKVFERMG